MEELALQSWLPAPWELEGAGQGVEVREQEWVLLAPWDGHRGLCAVLLLLMHGKLIRCPCVALSRCRVL